MDDVALVVLGWFGANVTGGAGKYLQDRVYDRLERVFGKASQKAHGRPIEASDRVKVKVLQEAAFTDDDVILGYLGGVLAASGPDDDSGAAIVAQIGRLSALQLRLHFVIYRELRRIWPLPDLSLTQGEEARRAEMRLDGADLLSALGTDDANAIGSALAVLHREDLIGFDFSLTWDHPSMTFEVRVIPTGLGAELLHWGTGAQRVGANLFFDQRTDDISDFSGVPKTPSTQLVQAPEAPR
jgi:hypothetical protein